MSINIDAFCDDGGFAAVDRRFILGGNVADDSSRHSKIANYKSSRFHCALSFVETPAQGLQRLVGEGKIPLIGINLIQQANMSLSRGKGENGPVHELAQGISFENFLDVYYSLFKEMAGRCESYGPGNFPEFSYLAFDKEKGKFRMGLMRLDEKRGLGVYELTEDRLLVRGAGIPPVHQYFLELAKGKGATARDMNKYFPAVAEKIQGMDLGELLFHLSNAYMKARSSPNIGGTFKVTLVTPEGLEVMSRPKRCAMNTFSGAYVAGLEAGTLFLSEDVPYEKIVGICRDILRKDDGQLGDTFELIARLTKQSSDAVTTKSPGKNYWLE